jgi:hypothetical protein
MGAKLLLVALLTVATNAKQDCSADKNNGFELSECGSGDTTICCHPTQQVCLSGTPKGGDEQFECSANRALYGMKVVTVLIIPICSCIFLLAAFIIMFKQVKGVSPKPPLALLCLAQTILSVLVVFSQWWKFCSLLGIRCSHRVSHDESEKQQVGLDYHHRAAGFQSASDDWCLWHKWYLRSIGSPFCRQCQIMGGWSN